MKKLWGRRDFQWISWATSATCWDNQNLGLPRIHRLTRDGQIQQVFDEGKFYKGNFVHLFVRPVDGDEQRAAFIVSQKTAGRAVDRNRIKRILRESYRRLLPSLTSGHHVILLATRDAHGGLTRQDIDEELEPMVRKAGLYDEAPIDADPER